MIRKRNWIEKSELRTAHSERRNSNRRFDLKLHFAGCGIALYLQRTTPQNVPIKGILSWLVGYCRRLWVADRRNDARHQSIPLPIRIAGSLSRSQSRTGVPRSIT